MTTEQRLTTVENDLETVKTLLMSAASYADSANRGLDRLTVKVDELTAAQNQTQRQLDRLVESQVQANTRLDRIERVLEGLLSNQATEREAREALRADLGILTQTVQRSGENTDRAISQLTERVGQLAQDLTASVADLVQMMSSLANDAAQDKAEIRRIWQYLLRQAGNGDRPS
jgi:chromosome segregation ATPase